MKRRSGRRPATWRRWRQSALLQRRSIPPSSPSIVASSDHATVERCPPADKLPPQRRGTGLPQFACFAPRITSRTEDDMAEELKIRVNERESTVAAGRDT